MRVELDGDWAEIRPAKKIPHGLTMAYREAFFEMAAAGAEAAVDDIDTLSEKQKKVALRRSGVAAMENGALMADERLTNALVLAIVKDWSYGAVESKVLLEEVPTADVDAILDSIDLDEYRSVLNPGFDDKTDREPGSPT